MSDLAATNCQTTCNTGCGWNTGNGCGGTSIIWILLLLSCCGNGAFGGNDGCGGNSCDSIIWILLLLCYCGGNNNSMLGCGC